MSFYFELDSGRVITTRGLACLCPWDVSAIGDWLFESAKASYISAWRAAEGSCVLMSLGRKRDSERD